MLPIKLYCGMDPREQAGLHVFLESVWRHTSLPVEVKVLTPKIAEQLNIGTDGTNAFSTLRFAVPELEGYAGWCLFVDGADMLCRADLAELWHQCTGNYAVKVVKHDYVPSSARKYIGTELEADNQAYPRKNWSSVVLWNCGHWAHFRSRGKLLSGDGKYLHRFGWLEDREIGEIPKVWNWLDEYGENQDAKICHWTNGIPGFSHYANGPHSKEWKQTFKEVMRGVQ